MERAKLELRVTDLPEVLFAMQARMAGLLRNEADAEADPRLARRLLDLADQFEVGRAVSESEQIISLRSQFSAAQAQIQQVEREKVMGDKPDTTTAPGTDTPTPDTSRAAIERMATPHDEHAWELDVWHREVTRCELDALAAVGTPSGGRGVGESTEDYCQRVKVTIDGALARLAYARKRLVEVEG